jgi:hypothetical protein
MINYQPANPQQQEMPLNVNPANARRRRALSEALAALAPKTVQNTGQGLAMMGMQAAGGFLDGMTERREQAAEQQRRAAQAQALSGTLGELPAGLNGEQFRALAASNPDLAKALATKILDSKLNPPEQFDQFTDRDGRTGQVSRRTGARTYHPERSAPPTATPGNSILDRNTGAVIGSVPVNPLPPDVLAQKKEIAKAGSPNNNVAVNTAANPIVDGFGKQFVEQRESASAGANSIRSIHEARKQLDASGGIMSGFGATRKLDLARAGAMFGLTDPKVIANTESFRSAIGSTVLAQAKALGANPTNTDREYIENVAAGKIELNEATIRRMLDINERLARDAIRRYNSTADQVLKELEANPNVDRTAMAITRTLGRVTEPDEYRRPDQPQPQGGPPAPVPVQGQPQAAPVQEGQPQPAPIQEAPQQAPPNLSPEELARLDAAILRQQQAAEERRRFEQSRMGVTP